jgi:hypothetical protein
MSIPGIGCYAAILIKSESGAIDWFVFQSIGDKLGSVKDIIIIVYVDR